MEPVPVVNFYKIFLDQVMKLKYYIFSFYLNLKEDFNLLKKLAKFVKWIDLTKHSKAEFYNSFYRGISFKLHV